METPDVFEDFASDDDSDSDMGDFSDDAIASVLDLMTERASARLSAIDEADALTERSSDSVASATSAARVVQCAPLATVDASSRPLSPQAYAAAPPQHGSAPSALSLLDELFPSTAPSDALVSASSSSSTTTALEVPAHTPSLKATGDSDLEQQPEWLSSLLEATTSSVAAEPIEVPAPAHAPTTSPTPDGNSRADEQPEWMRALLDEMYAESTKPQSPRSPHRSPVREPASSDSTAQLSVTSASSAAMDTPASVLQPRTEALAPLLPPLNDQALRQDTSPVLEISTTEATSGAARATSGPSSLCGNASSACSSLTWGRFSPDKMPVRTTTEPLCLLKSSRTSSAKQQQQSSKRLCYVPLGRSQKRRMRPRVATPAESELTFRPKINVRYLARLRSRREALGEAFTRRMATDIEQRRARTLERATMHAERAQSAERALLQHASLIAKGSERILQRSGRWQEPFAARLERLVRGSHTAKQRKHAQSLKRQQKRRAQAEAVAARACESLYQRGVAKQQRDLQRQHETSRSARAASARPKMTLQSERVLASKLRAELERVCSNQDTDEISIASAATAKSDRPGDQRISFVAFSCALLYFGLVPDAATPWRGDERVTLLWHAWRTFASADLDRTEPHQEQHDMPRATLERLLQRVMLRGRTAVTRSRHSTAQDELLAVLRVHYLSRTRTQTLAMQRLYSDRSLAAHSPPRHQTLSSASPTDSRRPTTDAPRKRLAYTLHGTQRSGAHDPLLQRQRATEAKVRALRRAQEAQEVAECTFQPRITQSPHDQQRAVAAAPTSWSCDLQLLSARARQYKSGAAASTFDRLYNDALTRQHNVLDKYVLAKRAAEEHAKREAAVSPTFVAGQSIDERLASLAAARAQNALPVDFYRKIDAMRSAAALRAQDAAAKAKRLVPVQFAKSADGRTLVVPFRFATDARAAAAAHGRGRPVDHRALMRRVMQRLRTEQQQQQRGDDEGDDWEDRATQFCLDVHLSPAHVEQLCFSARDDAAAVTTAFAARVGLSGAQAASLHRAVATHLEELVELER